MKELQHDNVVEYIDDFYIGPKLFIVMKFVPRNVLEVLESSPGNRLPRETGESCLGMGEWISVTARLAGETNAAPP